MVVVNIFINQRRHIKMNTMYFTLKRAFSTKAGVATQAQKKTSLYLWTLMPRVGKASAELKQQLAIPKGTAQRVAAFDDLSIQRILIGLRHSAALSNDGKLYMFGSGNWGILGQGTEKDAKFDSPKLVDYFSKKNLKVVDVALGEYHSVALTEDGSVYTWGYGGKTGFFNWMYSQEVGALGHGDKKHTFVPKKVEFFEQNNIKIKKISAGMYHTVAIATDEKVYTWGRGLYGVLGNGSNQYSLTPELNEELEYLRKEDPEGKIISKIDSADEYTGALMRDGTMWVWGKNDRGQMGVGSGIGIDMVESESIPREVILVDDKTQEAHRIKDFHAGMNTMLYQDADGGVYKTGLKLNYTPKKVKLMDEFSDPNCLAGMTCGRRHYVLWNKNNQLLVWGGVFKEKAEKDVDGFGLYYGSSLFEGGNIRQLSMKYGIFGALIEQQ